MKGKKWTICLILALVLCLLCGSGFAYAEGETEGDEPTSTGSFVPFSSDNSPSQDGNGGGSPATPADGVGGNGDIDSLPADHSPSHEGDGDNSAVLPADGVGSNETIDPLPADHSPSHEGDGDNSAVLPADGDVDSDKIENSSSSLDNIQMEQVDAQQPGQTTDFNGEKTQTEANTPPNDTGVSIGEGGVVGSSDYQIHFGEDQFYTIQGGSVIPLSQIQKALDIDGQVTEAISSNEALFSIGEEGGQLLFYSHNAFSTEEMLTLIIDGQTVVVKVTDANSKLVKNLSTSAEYDTVALAIANAGIEISVQLLGDVTENDGITIPDGKTVTIDLNGKTWNVSKFKVGFNSTLNLDLNGGQLNTTDYLATSSTSTLTISDNSQDQSGTVYMTESTESEIETTQGDITINGGNYIGDTTYGFWFQGDTTINGGTFSIPISNLRTMTVYGGTFSGTVENIAWGSPASMTITDGIFNGTVSANTTLGNSGLIINGGIYNGTVQKMNKPGVSISAAGGIFSDDSVKDCVVDRNALVLIDEVYYVGSADQSENTDLPGKTADVIAVPCGQIEAPGGTTIVNKTDEDILVVGVTVLPGESYTIPIHDPDPYSLSEDDPDPDSDVLDTASGVYVNFVKYYVVEGADQEWTKVSKNDIKIRVNCNAVIKVLIDGEEVAFTIEEDGTVTIAAEVLDALEAGEHEVTFVYIDGQCKTTITIL